MQMQTRIVARRGVADKVHLPRGGDQMHFRDLSTCEQAARQIDSVALHAGELTGRRRKRDSDFHASTSA
jgi:hypothetical protein